MSTTDQTTAYDRFVLADLPAACALGGLLLNLETAFARGEDMNDAVLGVLMDAYVRRDMEQIRLLAQARRPLADPQRAIAIQDMLLARVPYNGLHIDKDPPPGLDTDWVEDLEGSGLAEVRGKRLYLTDDGRDHVRKIAA